MRTGLPQRSGPVMYGNSKVAWALAEEATTQGLRPPPSHPWDKGMDHYLWPDWPAFEGHCRYVQSTEPCCFFRESLTTCLPWTLPASSFQVFP